MEADKDFIERKVAQFRARAQLADNVAEPVEGPPTPPNSLAASRIDLDEAVDAVVNAPDEPVVNAPNEPADDGVERVLANVVELKCS